MANSANPFELAGTWLRCALNMHSTESDGDLSPRALAAVYGTAGFDVVAITDHWRLTKVPSTRSLLTLPAAELTCDRGQVGETSDVLVYGIEDIPEDPGGDRRNWMVNQKEKWEQRTFPDLSTAGRFAVEQGGVAYLAHPYWTGMDATTLIESEHVSGVEVYNASGELKCGRGDSSMIWDAALEAGRQLYGIATDDSHVPLCDIGHAWTWVRVEEACPEAVLHALRTGLCYASAGPVLREVHWDGSTVEVACSPCRALVLQMERETTGCSVVAGSRGRRVGRILRTSETGLITRAIIESPIPDPKFVRVRAIDESGYSAWTNPL
jgi:hypothetical protein